MAQIIAFAANTTNIFPIANSTKGGQLITEFNLRSRESVGVGPSDSEIAIKYMTGPSFTHSDEDYRVRVQSDGAGNPISSTVLEILSGKAIVDGFFVENLANILIDMTDSAVQGLKGHLSIGLRIIYSTESTMSGSIEAENADSYFEGIQVVILPRADFKLPVDTPNDQSAVTAHLKLADFTYINGAIGNIVNNPERSKGIDASRLKNVGALLSDKYITKSGLQQSKFYTFAGKGVDPATGYDTWCDSTGSLMVWDNDPVATTTPIPFINTKAQFEVSPSGAVRLNLPHKQIDGLVNSDDEPLYYPNQLYPLPVADYNRDTSGTVDYRYTRQIKRINDRVDQIYNLPAGKQRQYISILESIKDLPTLNQNWNVGDYILVEQDMTLGVTDLSKYPATMYVVLPGMVSLIEYHSNNTTGIIPPELLGAELGRIDSTAVPETNIENQITYNEYWGIADGTSTWRGVPQSDYFIYVHTSDATPAVVTTYYYKVVSAGLKVYSSQPVLLTGEVPLAQEKVIGGFYNVPDTALDYGYVYRDSSGYLRLLDYELLRSGILAYQLGEDFATPSGLSSEDVQAYLDDRVNRRVAFPSFSHSETAVANNENPNVIHIDITLSAEDAANTINIYDIDSRFNASIYIHILGSANSNTTINISDCAKVRIDSNISGTPVIKLYRSGLYYDPDILNTLDTIQDLKLWYENFGDGLNLLVNDMTVRDLDPPSLAVEGEVDPWSPTVPNDNHFMYALRSITFNGSGNIIGCSIVVKNDTSSNILTGKYIIHGDFELPQGVNLIYPETRMTKKLKVIGTFTTAYPSEAGYYVLDTNFTALSQEYDADNPATSIKGVIAFYMDVSEVENIVGNLGSSNGSIDGWEPSMWNEFWGSAL